MDTVLALGAAWVLAGSLVAGLTALTCLVLRRKVLDRRGGTVECGVRRPGGVWRLGVAAYGPAELRWYAGLGVLLRADEVLARRTLSVTSQRPADAGEAARLGREMVVVTCRDGHGPDMVELALRSAALTGFLAWLESAPPGSHLLPH
ncbi:MAG TPA: DUF2550 domain-containing protein [Streptosporangiaceae bacterium]|nr:DUF2550 domain-containing protein [Streptosporangiaceae bacterium]